MPISFLTMPSVTLATGILVLGLVCLLAFSTSVALLRNYIQARKIGLPIRVLPISPLNPIWMLVDRQVLAIVKRLPLGLENGSFVKYNYRGFEIDDRYRAHQELGPAFIAVTPFRLFFHYANPDTVAEIFQRRVDFPRCTELTEVLDVFGPSIATSEGAKWKSLRKVTASCFNEPNNEIVWSEALWQSKDMLRYWTSKPAVTTAADDCRTLSLHVMSRAGFGKSFPFEGHDEREEASPAASYKHSLQFILENCVLIMAIGTKTLANPWLPRKLRELHEACNAFQRYMTNVYEDEKKAVAEGSSKARDRNLMTTLVRASQEAKPEARLTEREIYGNMFTFNFAGHDTTSHTFTFALYFLAANPDVQSWIHEEIQEVLGDEDEQWSYQQDFPRLRRCLAVMLETLRLYTPVPVSKWTADRTPTIDVGGDKTVVLPTQTMVIPSYSAFQTDPEYWGKDSLDWRPSRWIATNDSITSRPGAEELITPRRGTFVGWSDGARDCPGRKFSQVEFVATIARLFREHRVDPVLEPGEDLSSARDRVKELIETDSAPVLLLQMLHPERAPLKWTPWEGEP